MSYNFSIIKEECDNLLKRISTKEFKDSREKALKLINQLNWSNGFFRKDIGYKVIN